MVLGEKKRTVAGSFICSSGKGASMMKLLLSETMGPAFIFAMRSAGFGEPRFLSADNTCAYAKGTTSMGTPCFHYMPVLQSQLGVAQEAYTHVCSEYFGVLAVIGDDNPAVEQYA